MKKFLISAVLGLVLSVVPMSIFANAPHCPSLLRFDDGHGNVQVCAYNGNSSTQNGVLICEYDC